MAKIQQPEFECVYFSAGKKEKISKGDLLGLFLKLSGLKTFGAIKNHESLRKNLEKQQMLQFGRILQLKLPEGNRS
jgi:hypothetical protein